MLRMRKGDFPVTFRLVPGKGDKVTGSAGKKLLSDDFRVAGMARSVKHDFISIFYQNLGSYGQFSYSLSPIL
jgi:hypothetical protein